MTGTTISGAYLAGVTLSDPGNSNPVTILASATIGNPGGVAVQATGTLDWTIGNTGTVAATGTASLGISLSQGSISAGGVVTNYPGGTISGGYAGVFGLAAATVQNLGRIASTETATGAAIQLGGGAIANVGGTISGGRNGILLAGAGAVSNTGSIIGVSASGVLLAGGGAVTNATASTIGGVTSGVSIAGAGSVINAGTITASQNTGYGYSYTASIFTPLVGGVILGSGGLTNAATGTITSPRFGVALSNGGSIANAGSIRGFGITSTSTLGFGVWLVAGGTLTNEASGTIAGGLGGILATGTVASTITNDGFLSGAVRSAADLFSASIFTNAASGVITSGKIGVLQRAGGTIHNAGSINAPFGILGVNSAGNASNSGTIITASQNTGAGIQLKAGGTATNQAGGYIRGNWIGIQIGGFNRGTISYAPGGTVINDGLVVAHDTLTGSGAAVWVKGNGIVINGATGTITGGPYGIVSYNPITIVNRGSIGGSAYAHKASVAGNHDRVITYPGARFSGQVQGDSASTAAATGVLELGAGTLVGTIAGFGSKYTGFSNVIVDAGADWSLAGTVAASQTVAFGGAGAELTLANPGAVAGTITGFTIGTKLVLGGITDVSAATLGAGNVLTINETGGGTITLHLDPTQNFTGVNFGFTADGTGTALSVPCFAAGTRLLTDDGPVAVEHLRAGMMLRSAFGGIAPVIWIGTRRIDCTRHPRPQDVWPIRLRTGACGPNLPERDLLLSPDHALHIDGVLIPARLLVNGRTIVQQSVDSVSYYHVELPAHDVVFAEGVAAETYLDTGNRHDFANGGPALTLHPDFSRTAWESGGCAELVLEGPPVIAARAALLLRAATLGHQRTEQPDLRVMAGDQTLPARITGNRWRIALPPGTGEVCLRSRIWIPAQTRAAQTRAAEHDARRLGVAIADVVLDDAPLGLTSHCLAAGWHGPEAGWRWTAGAGRIIVGGARTLSFTLALGGTYWQDDSAPDALAPHAWTPHAWTPGAAFGT